MKSSGNLIVRQIFKICIPEYNLCAIRLENAEMPTEIDKSGPFICQLELDAPYLSRVLTTAVHKVFNRDLNQCRSLVACQLGEVQVWIAVRPRLHVVGHVREAEFREFGDDGVGAYFGPDRLSFLSPCNFGRNLSIR
jgi:hypothetical protein